MFRDCARFSKNVFVTWKENDVDKQDVDERKECWKRKRVLSHIWVKSESDLNQISTKSLTSFNQSWYTCNTELCLSLQKLYKEIENHLMLMFASMLNIILLHKDCWVWFIL